MNISLINESTNANTIDFKEFVGLTPNSCKCITIDNILDRFSKLEIEGVIKKAAESLNEGGSIIIQQNDLHEAAIFFVSGRIDV